MKSTRLSVTLETPLFDRVLIRKKETKGSRGEILKPKAAMAGDTFIALCQSHTLASPAKNLRPQDSNAWFRSCQRQEVTHCHASRLSHGVLLKEKRGPCNKKNALSCRFRLPKKPTNRTIGRRVSTVKWENGSRSFPDRNSI